MYFKIDKVNLVLKYNEILIKIIIYMFRKYMYLRILYRGSWRLREWGRLRVYCLIMWRKFKVVLEFFLVKYIF